MYVVSQPFGSITYLAILVHKAKRHDNILNRETLWFGFRGELYLSYMFSLVYLSKIPFRRVSYFIIIIVLKFYKPSTRRLFLCPGIYAQKAARSDSEVGALGYFIKRVETKGQKGFKLNPFSVL